MLEDHHVVGVEDGVETVRHDHHRALPAHRLDGALDQVLGHAVERVRGLVQDQQLGAANEGTRERDTLALSPRQAYPAVADDRVVAARELRDELVRVRLARGGLDLRIAGTAAPVRDVLPDRGVEEEGVLTDEADAAAPRGPVGAGQRDSVDRDPPGRGIVEAAQQVQQLAIDMARRIGARDASQLPPRAQFEEPARRRVALGLLMGQIVQNESLKVDRERVQERLGDLIASYPNPEEARKAYLQNPDAMKQVESSVLEEQVVDWVIDRARVTDKPMSFKDLTGFGQNESAAG